MGFLTGREARPGEKTERRGGAAAGKTRQAPRGRGGAMTSKSSTMSIMNFFSPADKAPPQAPRKTPRGSAEHARSNFSMPAVSEGVVQGNGNAPPVATSEPPVFKFTFGDGRKLQFDATADEACFPPEESAPQETESDTSQGTFVAFKKPAVPASAVFGTQPVLSDNSMSSLPSQSYSQSNAVDQSQMSQLSQEDFPYSTPADQGAFASQSCMRSPSPMQPKKMRRISMGVSHALSPNGLDDLRQRIVEVGESQQTRGSRLARQQRLCFMSQTSTSGNFPRDKAAAAQAPQTRLLPTSGSQLSAEGCRFSDFAVEGRSRVRRGPRKLGGNSSSPTEKENVGPQRRRAPPRAPGRRVRRSLPSTSTNPFLDDEGSGRNTKKRSRRGRHLPVLGSQDSVETSRYMEDFDEMSPIGSGAFSTTIKCRSRIDGCLYAVKRAMHRIRGQADKRKQLMEVFALAALAGCPSIVNYFGAFIEDDRLYIQLELCAGNVTDRNVPESERARSLWVTEFLKTVGVALRAMHSRKMAHLDVKPDNILLARRGDNVFKLADLGTVAHIVPVRTTPSAPPPMTQDDGDNRYVSLDLMNGSGRLAEADIFALGVSAYHLLLKLPEPPSGEWQPIRQGCLNLPEWTPACLRKLLLAMVHPEPTARPTACQVVDAATQCARALAATGAQADDTTRQLSMRCDALAQRCRELESMLQSQQHAPATTVAGH